MRHAGNAIPRIRHSRLFTVITVHGKTKSADRFMERSAGWHLPERAIGTPAQDLNYLLFIGEREPSTVTRTTDTRPTASGVALMRIASHSSIIRTPPTGTTHGTPSSSSFGRPNHSRSETSLYAPAGRNRRFWRGHTRLTARRWARAPCVPAVPDITIISERACRYAQKVSESPSEYAVSNGRRSIA